MVSIQDQDRHSGAQRAFTCIVSIISLLGGLLIEFTLVAAGSFSVKAMIFIAAGLVGLLFACVGGWHGTIHVRRCQMLACPQCHVGTIEHYDMRVDEAAQALRRGDEIDDHAPRLEQQVWERQLFHCMDCQFKGKIDDLRKAKQKKDGSNSRSGPIRSNLALLSSFPQSSPTEETEESPMLELDNIV